MITCNNVVASPAHYTFRTQTMKHIFTSKPVEDFVLKAK